MSALILIGIILAPVIILYLLKVNAVFVYLGLCMGFVVTQFVSGNSQVNKLVASSSLTNQYLSSNNNLKIALLLLPAILIMVFMIRTAKGGKFSPNILAAIAVGLLAVFLVVPLLPIDTVASISTNTIWQKFSHYQDVIIGLSSSLILVMLLLQRSKLGAGKGHRGHHKDRG